LGSIIDLLVNVIVPVAAGWFIVLMNSTYSGESFIGYKTLMIIGFILLFASGFCVQFSKIQHIAIDGMLLRRPNKIWRHMRVFHVIHNIQVGVTLVLSSVLVLVLVGGEGVLGTLQTITAGLSTIALYYIGRKSTLDSSWKLVVVGSIIFFIGTCVLTGTFTWIGVLAYTLVITMAWSFQYVPSNSVSMELMDMLEHDPEKQYAYVFDNELFYNIGRSIGVSIIVFLALCFNENISMRWSPLIVGLIQLPLGWFIYRTVKEVQLKKLA
jgi:YQGE family putative transporter